MAVPEKLLDRGETQIIAAASNDPAASPNSTTADFRIRLTETLQFAGGGEEWVVTLADAVFDHPGGTPVYVSSNLILGRVDGSELTQVIARLPSTNVATPGYSWVVNSTLPQWLPLSKNEINDVEIQLTDSTGALLPLGVGATTVTLMIRRATMR